MWGKNLKLFIKHLANNKLYTFITVFGFAISLSVVILLSFYIKNELTVNKSQEKRDRIYRLSTEKFGDFSPPVGQWVQNGFPEIESYTRTYTNGGIISRENGKKLKTDLLLADSTFFTIFTFPLTGATPQTALKTVHSIVLTRAMARKLFGDESPLGKRVMLNMEIPCTVTAIVDDISKTSAFKKVDAVINFRCIEDMWNNNDVLSNSGICSFGLYFLVKPNADITGIEPKVLKMFKKDFWIYKNGFVKEVRFVPLSQTHFYKIVFRELRQTDKTLIIVLFAIVVIILFLAIINYINLSIAQSGMRIKEIAVKKLLGSSKSLLITQQVIETVMVCILAFFIAVVFAFLLQPVFNSLFSARIDLRNEFTPAVVTIAILLISITGIVSGIIPAVFITGLNAIGVIKGTFKRKSKKRYSVILIGFQYVVVIVLLISTAFLMRQTRFMQNYNPGFNTKNIIWMTSLIETSQESGLRNRLLSLPGVKRVSFVAGSPIDGGNNNSFLYKGKPVSFQAFVVDSSFFPMMHMKITPTATAYSKQGVWINRKAVKELELDSLPGFVPFGESKLPLLGVIDDFNYRSLHEKPGPVIIRQSDENTNPWSILVEVEGKNLVSTVDKIRETYSDFNGGLPFDYGFFDETIKNWYQNEKRTSAIVGYFALLSIIISVMGIFAMSLFFTQQKTKEIGIRKVNGATVSEIVLMLNKDFIKWVFVSFVVAVPIAWFAMHRWLQNFAYRIELSWWVFLLAGIAVSFIALLTVSLQTFRAARRNPVEALRYE